ncbi:MAG: carbohydrate-binding domain-containing protein [Bacillota bacterium]|nr:carbohydrate-binding domain-containing protein [Bacillota bacterium]
MRKQRPGQCRTMKSASYIQIVSILLAVMLLASSCSSLPTETESEATSGSTQIISNATTEAGGIKTETDISSVVVNLKDEDLDDSWNETQVTGILFQESAITIDGDGATVNGSIVTITAAGTYLLSGILNDGQILVNADKEAIVRLVLNDIMLTGMKAAPLQVQSADKVILILADASENTITDARPALLDVGDGIAVDETEDADEEVETEDNTDEVNAAIYSKEDLTITGDGHLAVVTTFCHGINCKDDLVITGGTIAIQSAGDGIRGRDSVVVQNADLKIDSDEDGIRSSNSNEADMGNIVLESGLIEITAGRDGIQAAGQLLIYGGTLVISTGGGSATVSHSTAGAQDWRRPGSVTAQADETVSTKGLKAATAVIINSGSITIDAADDAVHSNNLIEIRGGTLLLNSGDDGIHADTMISIFGGSITIGRSYEGIESAAIYIHDGDIRITASDDAINIAGGVDGSAMNGRPGQNNFSLSESSAQRLEIHGGSIIADGQGDGIDVNGTILMTGGTVLVYGPTSDMNGALDYDGTFTITGGLLVASGSAGMAQAPDASSSQHSILVNLSSVIPAETVIHVTNSTGDTIIAFSPIRTIQSLVVSSPDLKHGDTVTIYTGGDSGDKIVDGLLIGETVQGGVPVASLTLNQVTTTFGSVGMAGGRPGRR